MTPEELKDQRAASKVIGKGWSVSKSKGKKTPYFGYAKRDGKRDADDNGTPRWQTREEAVIYAICQANKHKTLDWAKTVRWLKLMRMNVSVDGLSMPDTQKRAKGLENHDGYQENRGGSEMKYLSVCSGIEAATVAWHHLGWKPVGFSEIEPFPSAVLNHHYPETPNFGDMTNFKTWNIDETEISLLVGGTPCQSFSVAGLRKGLSDDRGNLALTFCQMADHYNPDFVLWENVPGVLSSKDNAFGCFLAGLAGEDDPLVAPGGKWTNAGYVLGPERAIAWRILDAQYFGLAQRRRRLFVVGCPVGGADPREILFEREGLRRDTPPSREKGQRVTADAAQCFEPRSPDGHARVVGDICPTLNRMGGGQREPCVVQPVAFDKQRLGEYGDSGVGSTCAARDYKDATDLVVQPIPINTMTVQGRPSDNGRMGLGIGEPGDPAPTLTKGPSHAVAFGVGEQPELGHCPRSGASRADKHESTTYVAQSMQVRRLTPVERERLQGFPDGFTAIPWRKKTAENCPDGPRYKALGNSMAVPVMRWIGERINGLVKQNK